MIIHNKISLTHGTLKTKDFKKKEMFEKELDDIWNRINEDTDIANKNLKITEDKIQLNQNELSGLRFQVKILLDDFSGLKK